ncbi:transcriptional regulator, LacI family [Lachnospiraceae bacterium XBB1006]|nr:transcriptional regulator, LacI family [Lachnospiraceae bacterium XBB1006]
MVSIKDVAKKCGVSPATVSKALNDRNDVSRGTKEKVRAVATELGYFANPSARALKTNRTYNIGLLYTGAEPGLTHEYFSIILENFKAAIEAKGYDITFVNRGVKGQGGTYLEHCLYRQFDGVAVITADYNDPEVIKLCNSKIPVVTIDYVFEKCPSVVADNTTGMRILTEYAIARGHREIIFIHGSDTEVTRSRIMGFTMAMREHGIPVDNHNLIESAYHDADQCYEITKELLKREKRPTLIIFPDDYSYLGGYRAIHAAKLSIPNDISAIGYDNIAMSSVFGLTTFDQDAASIGRLAVEKLLDNIENPDGYKEHSVVMGKMVERNTVKDIT